MSVGYVRVLVQPCLEGLGRECEGFCGIHPFTPIPIYPHTYPLSYPLPAEPVSKVFNICRKC